MKLRLGINTGFAVNRFSAPGQWIPLVAEVFGLKTVQMTADLLSPYWPDEIIDAQIRQVRALAQTHGVDIKHTFTGAFTRLNHMAHPDAKIREYWVKWFCRFVDISVALGAQSMGSHFGILTQEDYTDITKREERFRQNMDGWRRVSEHAAQKGLKYLTWEPMSIGREMGETIAETRRIHAEINRWTALPMKLCLDVDHGDVLSDNPDDTNPYVWIKEFIKETPMIHIKQTLTDKGGHWPFTPDKNAIGKITPEKLINALQSGQAGEIDLLLELSFRERQPFDSRVIEDIRSSVDYWRPFVEI